MSSVATTKMSSKGQVVIPEEIREQLGLDAGTQFVVLGHGDSVMLKVITQPSRSDIKAMMNKVTAAAKREGLTKADMDKAIKKVRSKKM